MALDDGDDLELDYLLLAEDNHLKSMDYGDEQSNGASRRRPSRSSPSKFELAAPVVCPQVDCELDDRIKLKNDCCTYCRGFDFCKLQTTNNKWFHHLQCHPNAFCINLSANFTQAEVEEMQTKRDLATIDSMFKCHCKPGFAGDGRYCRDVNECSDRKLHRCDTKTTSCVNLEGGHECRCKRGFRPRQAMEEEEPSANRLPATSGEQNVTSMLIGTGTPRWDNYGSAGQRRSCIDINECLDGKLNRCHPQARCINLRGSYKCQCKRGYLGDGVECHKWFSSDPNVAAYLYRHSAGNGTTSGNEAAKAIGAHHITPLSILNDPDDDQVDESTSRGSHQSESGRPEDYNDGDDDDEDGTDEDDNDDQDDDHMPKLSESKWEPLQGSPMEKDSLLLQQVSRVRSFERSLHGPEEEVVVERADRVTGGRD